MKYILYSHRSIDENDIQQAIKALKNDFIARGPKIQKLEDTCHALGSQYLLQEQKRILKWDMEPNR